MKTFFLPSLGLVSCLVACSGDVAVDGAGGASGSTSASTSAPAASTGSVMTDATTNATTGSANGGGSVGVTTTVASSSTGVGGGLPNGDCAGDADCPPNGKCVVVNASGWTACQYPATLAMACTSPGDQCCTSADCPANQQCIANGVQPSCGGAMLLGNQCASDECQTDQDCAMQSPDGKGLCLPAGVYGRQVRACIYAQCASSADCSPGSVCGAVHDDCCTDQAPDGFYCIAPSGCHADKDCPQGQYCVVDNSQMPQCTNSPPPCPG